MLFKFYIFIFHVFKDETSFTPPMLLSIVLRFPLKKGLLII